MSPDLQVLAAGFFATMFTLKRFWRRAADVVLRRRTPPPGDR